MHRVLRRRSKNSKKPQLWSHFLRGMFTQDRRIKVDMLSHLQNSPLKTFQGKESPKKFHSTRLCRQAVGNAKAEQFLLDSYQRANETLLHNLQAPDLHRVHRGSFRARIC